MIELTVKTLDSQNHSFSVEDDITVAQFKDHIAGVINIPVDSQRLIYCGRVLQDSKKLVEYDVNGKVIHLVQRAPPSVTRRSRSPTPATNHGGRRGIFQAPVYLGSMALPSGIMEAQGIVPPPPTQSLSGSRLNVARRMLKKADNILKILEDPEGHQSTRETPSEESPEDVTPVFAAQVFVPNPGSDDALAAAVSAMENGILQDQATSVPTDNNSASPVTVGNDEETQETQESQPGSSTSNTTQNTTPSGQTNQLPENASSTNEMAKLLDELNKTQERLRPFLDRYHRFMAEDPTVEGDQNSEGVQQTQTVINRVSEIMHLLGHAYHSLSDVMVQVSQPPPRPLLCRPILIQHSAVLQAGIPIQVEAQINLTPDRRPSENANASPPNSNAANNTTDSSTTSPAATTTEAPRAQPNITSQQIRPNVHEIRIDSFPIDFRNMSRHQAYMNMMQHVQDMNRRQPSNNNSANSRNAPANATEGAANTNTAAETNAAAGNESAQSAAQPTRDNAQQPRQQEPSLGNFVPPVFVNNMNPNMEFFMEVTPESITIDSLETTVVTSAAQADNVLRGTFGGAPPELLQSILQAVAGQMMGGGLQPQATTPPNGAPATTETTQATTGTNTTQATSSGGTNINSQARGHTQTHPTTSTQTRSTPRPHVHLAQHTMQGFDPFLPCNSHHIRRRRHGHGPSSTAANNVNASTDTETQNNNQNNNPLYNILQGFLRTVGNHMGRMRERPATQENASNSQTNAAPTGTAAAAPQPNASETLPPFSTFLSHNLLNRMAMDTRSGQGATIAHILQSFPDYDYVEGESLFTDLMMVLARELNIGDIITLSSGQLYPLSRIRPALRTFFRNRVLQGECATQPAIDRGAARFIAEITPIIESMGDMPVREDIDIVQSVLQLFRARFPGIIFLVMSRNHRSLSCLVEQCIVTMRHLCGLLMHCSVNGQRDVEACFRAMVTRYTQGIPPDILNWTIVSSTAQLRLFLSTLDVNPVVLQPYIVRRSDNRTQEPQPSQPPTAIPVPNEPEAMECEDASVVESAAEPAPGSGTTVVTNDSALDIESLPNVVIGSESWHQVTPNDWIPIITRDIQKQRRQNPQPAFSDAYLSGMPSKRRKIVESNKPQGNVSHIISDAVRHAVTASGLTTSVPLDTVAQAASTDPNLQAAYRELLRSRVQANLRVNPDFNPERFPNASSYFNVKKN